MPFPASPAAPPLDASPLAWPPPGRARRARAAVALLAVLGLGFGVTGCSSDPDSVSGQAKDGSQKNFISGDGTVQVIAPDRRLDPVTFTGTTVDGKPWSTDSTRGKPLVVNIWASWCPPCQAEAPAIKAVADKAEFAGTVAWVGLNQRESPQTALAQVQAWGVTFPNLADDGGIGLQQLQGRARAMPSTLVLDPQGRIAAFVGGPVSEATLTGMIEDVLAEGPGT